MTKVKAPEPPPPTPDSADGGASSPGTISKAGEELLKASTAQTKSKGAHKPEFQRPHQAHVFRHIRVAGLRHTRAELDEEARRHHVLAPEGPETPVEAQKVEEKDQIDGLNFDERRKKKGKKRDDEHEEDRREDEGDDAEDAAAAAQGAKEKGFASAGGAGKYFQDQPEDRFGDLTLTNPNEMKRLLGPSVRFAQHAMLLAEDRLKSGAPREEAIGFLASLYIGLADRAYAHKAIKEFGAGTGILDIYPLEVIKHLLEHVPTFFSKIKQARFLSSSKPEGYRGETGKPIVLTYDPKLRIRGFALKDGARPGYLLEPVDPPGTYHLVFHTPGKFTVMISAITKGGEVQIEEFAVEVTDKSKRRDSSSSRSRPNRA